MRFAENLRILRTNDGMSQTNFAERIGVAQSTLANWERGEREPELSMIVELANFFSITIDNLVLGEIKPRIPLYASNIHYLRKRNGMSQRELAEKFGVQNPAVSKWEKGESEPSISTLSDMADFFEVTLDQIVKTDLSGNDREVST